MTQAQRQQLRADHEAAAALCLKMGMRSCKELRGAKQTDLGVAFVSPTTDRKKLGSSPNI